MSYLEPSRFPPVQTLSLRKQKEFFKPGELVYIRHNASSYTYDWIGEMDDTKGYLFSIVSIGTIENNHFGATIDSFEPNSNPDDLVIQIAKNDGDMFYFYYKSVLSPKQIVPDYSSNRNRIIEANKYKYKYNTIVLYAENQRECEIFQNILFKNNILWYNKSIIRSWSSDEYPLTLLANIENGHIDWQQPNSFLDNYLTYNHVDSTLYTIDKLSDIISILKYGIIGPNYKSNKNRIVEKLKRFKNFIIESKIYKWDEILFKANNEEENENIQKFLFDNKYYWNEFDNNVVTIHYSDYPHYIFANSTYKEISAIIHPELFMFDIDSNIDDYLKDCTYTDKHIYTINDIDVFKNIIKKGEKITKPNYNPKSNDIIR